MKQYFIWTEDDVKHSIEAENERDAINKFLEKYSYIIEEIMYVAHAGDRSMNNELKLIKEFLDNLKSWQDYENSNGPPHDFNDVDDALKKITQSFEYLIKKHEIEIL
jgi:hypothetical protein